MKACYSAAMRCWYPFLRDGEEVHTSGGKTYHPECCPREDCALEHPELVVMTKCERVLDSSFNMGPVRVGCGSLRMKPHGSSGNQRCEDCGRIWWMGRCWHTPETTILRETNPTLYAELLEAEKNGW